MTNKKPHINWFHKTNEILQTQDGKSVEVWELRHLPETEVLKAWAKHFRNHYCLDEEIDKLRDGTDLSRSEYLNKFVFPDHINAPGPSIRAGDFAEILIADLMEYILGFWVPRSRYGDKAIPNESTKGVDILGFKMLGETPDSQDTLITCEAKASLSGRSKKNTLQEAINDSAKDMLRKAHSLHALKKRLITSGDARGADIIKRFQDPIGNPYKEFSAAAAILNSSAYDTAILTQADASKHLNNGGLMLIVMHGEDLMTLTHSLYKRAANEA